MKIEIESFNYQGVDIFMTQKRDDLIATRGNENHARIISIVRQLHHAGHDPVQMNAVELNQKIPWNNNYRVRASILKLIDCGILILRKRPAQGSPLVVSLDERRLRWIIDERSQGKKDTP